MKMMTLTGVKEFLSLPPPRTTSQIIIVFVFGWLALTEMDTIKRFKNWYVGLIGSDEKIHGWSSISIKARVEDEDYGLISIK